MTTVCGNLTLSAGSAARTVYDNEAINILFSYLDANWNNGSLTESQMFGNALSDSANHIMRVTPSTLSRLLPWIIGAVAVVAVLLVLRGIMKSRAEKARAEADIQQARVAMVEAVRDELP